MGWQPAELGGKLPPLVPPEGPGYMPLYCAAQYIATRGGTVEIDPNELSVWQGAFEQLLTRIASGEVTTIGVRDGAREKLEAHMFASIRVAFPFQCPPPLDLLGSEELYLWSSFYIDEEEWQSGWNDALETRYGVKWSKLMVLKSDVARCWPRERPVPEYRRHRKSPKRDQLVQKIRNEIEAGDLTVDQLKGMKEKQLTDRYGGLSRDTCRKARQVVLRECCSTHKTTSATNDN
jgi:hypothetical protein